MAEKTVKVRANKDGTITIRVGRNIEHVGRGDKTKAELFDYVKYAIISKEVPLKDYEVVELIEEALKDVA